MNKLLALAVLGLAMTTSAHAFVVFKEATYRDGATPLKGYLAYDDAMTEKRPGMIVVHEWWGITQHVKDYTRDLASKGYTVLAVDMFGNGKTVDNPKDAGKLADELLGSAASMKSRFEAGMKYLVSQPTVDRKRIGALGFCMGGAVVLNMARMGEDLAGVASFHGMLEAATPARAGQVKGRILVLNGADDPFVKPQAIAAFRKEMEVAKVNYRIVDYPGAMHSFTNPDATGKGRKFKLPLAYDADADRRSKAEMLKFFSEIFDKR